LKTKAAATISKEAMSFALGNAPTPCFLNFLLQAIASGVHLSGHDVRLRAGRAGEAILIVAQDLKQRLRRRMQGKARFVFPVVITAIIVFVAAPEIA
jgi:hypothetical protein